MRRNRIEAGDWATKIGSSDRDPEFGPTPGWRLAVWLRAVTEVGGELSYDGARSPRPRRPPAWSTRRKFWPSSESRTPCLWSLWSGFGAGDRESAAAVMTHHSHDPPRSGRPNPCSPRSRPYPTARADPPPPEAAVPAGPNAATATTRAPTRQLGWRRRLAWETERLITLATRTNVGID
jgi:hypothetical protein